MWRCTTVGSHPKKWWFPETGHDWNDLGRHMFLEFVPCYPNNHEKSPKRVWNPLIVVNNSICFMFNVIFLLLNHHETSPFDRNLFCWGNMFQPSKMTQIWKFMKRNKLFCWDFHYRNLGTRDFWPKWSKKTNLERKIDISRAILSLSFNQKGEETNLDGFK